MTESLKALLFYIRQHAAYQELLRAIEAPKLPRYRKGLTPESFGAEAIHASGAMHQHERWIALLTGNSSRLEDNNG